MAGALIDSLVLADELPEGFASAPAARSALAMAGGAIPQPAERIFGCQ